MKKILLSIGLLAVNAIACFASTQAIFSLDAKTPTTITVPANPRAFVQYVLKNNTTVQRTLTMQPIPNVTQRSDDSSECSYPTFTLAPGQSCKLTLYVDGESLNASYTGGPIVCKTKGNSNEPDPFLCSQPETSMVLSITPAQPAPTPAQGYTLYVSNWDGNSISLCYINANTGNLEHCLVSAVSNTFANPEALAISNNVLFVANIGGGMSSCEIDLQMGELSNCINATDNTNAAYIHRPDGIAINGTTAYISNVGPQEFNQGMSVCTVTGGSLTGCLFQSDSTIFSNPSDIAYHNDYLYITNFKSNTMQTGFCIGSTPYCTTDKGSVSGTSGFLNQPEGLTFANVYAYFTNHGDNTVTLCQAPADAPPTNFTNCTTTGGYFSGFGNLAILTSPSKAFIPSGLKSIGICDVSGLDGSLSNCVNSTELNFNNPSGLIIN